jgi:exodeoxyribonuclease V alpha subunit
VLIPVVRCRLLDRAMLYTAITRARRTIVLLGDPARIASAVAQPPRAWRRLQALDVDRAIGKAGVAT